MNIYVDTDVMVQKSNEIKVLTDELKKIMEEIELLVLSVNGEWQGDAEKAFSEKIIYVKKQFSHISTFFDDYADLLNKFAYVYEQQESEITSKINLA